MNNNVFRKGIAFLLLATGLNANTAYTSAKNEEFTSNVKYLFGYGFKSQDNKDLKELINQINNYLDENKDKTYDEKKNKQYSSFLLRLIGILKRMVRERNYDSKFVNSMKDISIDSKDGKGISLYDFLQGGNVCTMPRVKEVDVLKAISEIQGGIFTAWDKEFGNVLLKFFCKYNNEEIKVNEKKKIETIQETNKNKIKEVIQKSNAGVDFDYVWEIIERIVELPNFTAKAKNIERLFLNGISGIDEIIMLFEPDFKISNEYHQQAAASNGEYELKFIFAGSKEIKNCSFNYDEEEKLCSLCFGDYGKDGKTRYTLYFKKPIEQSKNSRFVIHDKYFEHAYIINLCSVISNQIN